jgi:hypothetical protein
LRPINTKKNESKKSFDEIYADLGLFEYSEDGFKITTQDFSKDIKWTEIHQINAYKKDVYAYDLIVMEIVCGENSLTINEETLGWFQLVLKLKEVFDSIPKDWDMKITQPPFKTNFTTIYNKT